MLSICYCSAALIVTSVLAAMSITLLRDAAIVNLLHDNYLQPL